MSHHPKKTIKKHWLQLIVLLVGLIIWFIPTPEGLETQAWHLFAVFITAIFAVIIIGMNFREIPEILKLIVTSAFGANQAFGGIVGMAIMWGVKRGIYSNEAGQGTAPHAAAAAEVSHPAKQG